MVKDIVIAVVSSVIGGIIGFFFEQCKEKRVEQKRKDEKEKEIIQNRPEMEIVDYKDYLSRPGYGIKQKSDIDVFVADIHKIVTTGESNSDMVYAYYRESDLVKKDWCCVIYTFKNMGKTDISIFDLICNYKRDTCIFNSNYVEMFTAANVLNYRVCYDKKIRVGESITVKLCYHKEHIGESSFSANMCIGMEDDNGRYWLQPLFSPNDKLYDSYSVTYKEYRDEIRIEKSEECFKKPWLW